MRASMAAALVSRRYRSRSDRLEWTWASSYGSVMDSMYWTWTATESGRLGSLENRTDRRRSFLSLGMMTMARVDDVASSREVFTIELRPSKTEQKGNVE
jgi:hypothetical protein